MPRPAVARQAAPTAAQFAYGTLTVVCTATALLLLTQARSQLAVLAICLAALAAGVLAAVAAPLARRTRAALPAPAVLPRVSAPERAVVGQDAA
ncbi:hypothetical protein ACFQLX_10015 [Streptomyces polyrhachis]|uniref:Uncharacterized protein n=1 Tax=Streptomyces polyrhachis TaxID=1282885 RepID=A0ABW2GCH2_9ACTN